MIYIFSFITIISMGNSSYQSSTLTKHDWIWVGNHTGIDLFKRQSDSLIAERRIISLDNRFALETELQIYTFRSNNNYGLVRVYQVDGVQEQIKSKGSFTMCACSESKKLNVYSERIKYRLSDLPQLTFAQSLFILKEVLNSFYQVYQKFGPLHVNSQLIGINDQNKVRVWVNQNWALNHPSHKIPVLLTINNLHLPPQLRNQREMVMNIIQVIEQKTQQGRFPLQFGEGIYANSVNFRQAKRFLAKYINEDYKDYIPAIIKRSTVLASQRQISQYNSCLLNPQKVISPFIENNNVRIVESMYQQYNKVNSNISLEKRVSSPQIQIQNSNYPANKNIQNNFVGSNVHTNTYQQGNLQRFPIISNRVLNFAQVHDNNLKLQTNQLLSLSVPQNFDQNFVHNQSDQTNAFQKNLGPHSTYLKFKLIEEDSTQSTLQQLPKYSQALLEKWKTSQQSSPQKQHSTIIKPTVNNELNESSEHKAAYKIIDMMKQGQVPKVK